MVAGVGGRRLIDAKDRCGHGKWLPWLEREFGWSDNTAQRFVDVAYKAGKFPKLGDLSIPVSGLYLLARPDTPAEMIDEVACLPRAPRSCSKAGGPPSWLASAAPAESSLPSGRAVRWSAGTFVDDLLGHKDEGAADEE
jgi:hypothetical protein